MYVTAHRLASRFDEEGTNAFLHLHGAQLAWPDDPGRLIETNPGELEERMTEIAPGGNRVLSFLDVVAPDGTGRGAIIDAVSDLSRQLEDRANPTWHEHGQVVIKFGVDRDLEKKGIDARREELKYLLGYIERILARRSS